MKKHSRSFFQILLIISLIITACTTKPVHPGLVQGNLPEMIPLRDFFLSVDSKFGYRVSPDGKKLSWIESRNWQLKIYYKTIGTDDTRIINDQSRNSTNSSHWLQDNRHMIYAGDKGGNENFHIYMVDTEHPEKEPIDLTPFDGIRAWLHRTLQHDPEHIIIQHNRRSKAVFDLYKLNIKTRQEKLLAENPGNVTAWVTDDRGQIRGRVVKSVDPKPDKKWTLEIKSESGSWSKCISWDSEESVAILGFTPDDKGLWLASNRNRDKISLTRLDIDTKIETVIYDEPGVDLDNVIISNVSSSPLLATSNPDYQKLHFFDPGLENDIRGLFKGKTGVRISSIDNNERIFTFHTYSDKRVDFYLYNKSNREKSLLSTKPIIEWEEHLSTTTPVFFKARDGLTIPGYLTIPKGTAGRNLPMILLVHGGPWERDYWEYNAITQFLANRGYAVFRINFRGSKGYGRSFMETAVGEFAGKMHTDLIDGVGWAVDIGIADPGKVCIMGGSYGGYATLVGLTFTPDTFACGVDLVGPSNLVTLVESFPKYWELHLDRWHKYVGNPENPEDRKRMEAKSPLFQVDKIRSPLLIVQGANDPRVTQEESDQMVEAMNKAGKSVYYMLFQDEGHGLRKWQNRLRFYRKIEDFLAEHLGGRSAGFDYYELGLIF